MMVSELINGEPGSAQAIIQRVCAEVRLAGHLCVGCSGFSGGWLAGWLAGWLLTPWFCGRGVVMNDTGGSEAGGALRSAAWCAVLRRASPSGWKHTAVCGCSPQSAYLPAFSHASLCAARHWQDARDGVPQGHCRPHHWQAGRYHQAAAAGHRCAEEPCRSLSCCAACVVYSQYWAPWSIIQPATCQHCAVLRPSAGADLWAGHGL
jgi:hypothetical protein